MLDGRLKLKMKRSKILNRISRTIIAHIAEKFKDKSPFNICEINLMCEDILTVMEREGMEPPLGPEQDFMDYETDRWGLEVPGTRHTKRVMLHEWEPEDMNSNSFAEKRITKGSSDEE